MFNYPVEKYTLRFYKYRLFGLEDKPIVIEAYNKIEARQKLTYLIQSNPELNGKIVVSEWLSLPIYGETTKTINGYSFNRKGLEKYFVDLGWQIDIKEADWSNACGFFRATNIKLITNLK